MITISLPTPTPKEVWKKVSSIIRNGKHLHTQRKTLYTADRLSRYALYLEQTYNIDKDLLIEEYFYPQWLDALDKWES